MANTRPNSDVATAWSILYSAGGVMYGASPSKATQPSRSSLCSRTWPITVMPAYSTARDVVTACIGGSSHPRDGLRPRRGESLPQARSRTQDGAWRLQSFRAGYLRFDQQACLVGRRVDQEPHGSDHDPHCHDGKCDQRVCLCGSTRRDTHVDDADEHPDVCEHPKRWDDNVLQEVSLVLASEGDQNETASHSIYEERAGVTGKRDQIGRAHV